MWLEDEIYGRFEITEPVLKELLNAPELQRLKGISMAGYYPGCPEFGNPEYNRYNHSIGVLLLLRKFGAPLPEQIAGLIHDVSHSAFSHTIDYIRKDAEGEKTHDGQDKIHDGFVRASGLKTILERHGFNPDDILDDRNFPLKENELPDICADRLDYAVRQGYYDYHYLSFDEVQKIWNGLAVCNGSFVFADLKAAGLYAHTFCKLNEIGWSGLSTAVMFSVSSAMFRRALAQGYVEFADFHNCGDAFVIGKIERHLSYDAELLRLYRLLQRPVSDFCNSSASCLETLYCKNRIVNPLVLQKDGSMKRYADIDADYAAQIKGLPKFKQYGVALKAEADKIA